MFYVITLHVTGLNISAAIIEKQMLETRVHRLTMKARNKLMVKKLMLYQWLKRNASFQIQGSYVLHESKLQEFYRYYNETLEEFRKVVREVHSELIREWPRLKNEIVEELRKRIEDKDALERLLRELDRLDPPENPDDLATMDFSIIPLMVRLSPHHYAALPAEMIETLEQARRRLEEEIRQQYIQRIHELNARLEELEQERMRLERELRRMRHDPDPYEYIPIRASLDSINRIEDRLVQQLNQIQREVNDLKSMGIDVDQAVPLLNYVLLNIRQRIKKPEAKESQQSVPSGG